MYERSLIYHIDPKGDVRLFANGVVQRIQDLELGPDRVLYALGRNDFARVDLDDGERTLITSGGLLNAGQGRNALAIGLDGTPYALVHAGSSLARLVRIDPETGAQTQLATFAGLASALEREPSGTLLVVVLQGVQAVGAYDLHRFDPATGVSQRLSSGRVGGWLSGLAVARDGSIFTGFDASSIQRLDPFTGLAQRIATGPLPHNVEALDLDRFGNLLFWGLPNDAMVRVDRGTGATSSGYGSVWFGGFGAAAAVLHPQCSDGFDNDADGRLDFPEDRGCADEDDDSEHLREDVAIEIAPLRPDNQIPLLPRFPIFVAVLGSESIDALAIGPEGLTFGPASASPRERRPKHIDVDRDGFVDAVYSFELGASGISEGDTTACLEGMLEGEAFRACDEIRIR